MNGSGMRPINLNVLVKPDEIKEKTAGGLYLPEQNKDRQQHAQSTGLMVAACADAFAEMAANARPTPGSRVFFARYAGAEIEGKDGETYRLVKDIDITGVEE